MRETGGFAFSLGGFHFDILTILMIIEHGNTICFLGNLELGVMKEKAEYQQGFLKGIDFDASADAR